MKETNKTIIEVNDHHVSCDGGGGTLGHPLTYYVIPDNEESVTCLYCDKVFVLKEHHH